MSRRWRDESGTALVEFVWLAILLIVPLLYIVLACAFFTRVFRQAVRTGSLARYSAESVS